MLEEARGSSQSVCEVSSLLATQANSDETIGFNWQPIVALLLWVPSIVGVGTCQ